MNKSPQIAYFSAEIGISQDIKTYSGGLGVLAGDTIKAMADLNIPLCAVTLLYKKGYFKQEINENNEQVELEDSWDFQNILTDTEKTVMINIDNIPIKVKIWEYKYRGVKGHEVPIYFLDTHLDCNPCWAHDLSQYLYVGNRLRQEIVLGIGGIRALRELGYEIKKYHMNEGHSAFLTLELYKHLGETIGWDDCLVKERCVFTTHTPIPAGHDKFSYDDFFRALQGEPTLIPWHIKRLAGEDELNMTKLAMSLSDYHNAVSRKHGEITKEMFGEFTVSYITNGIHTLTWTAQPIKDLFDRYCEGWRDDASNLNKIFKAPNSEVFKAHKDSKRETIRFCNERNIVGSNLKEEVLTVGFARRFIQYKDAELIFSNLDHLKKLGKKVQFIFAGKAHKRDGIGKSILRRIIERSKELIGHVEIAFIPNYDMEVASALVTGCDIWLNTPIPPNEASGTSGMKASTNGCLHFSRLDGWSIEAFEMNGGGFPIEDYNDFITSLEYKIIPMYYSQNKNAWIEEMKLAIGVSGAYFNTHRMAKEYVEKCYKDVL